MTFSSPSSPIRILLTGGQGKTSSRLARLLRLQGHAVRQAGRRPAQSRDGQPDSVVFDWYDPSTYEAALTGMDAVYLVAPPDLHPEQVMIPFIRKAREASVRRFVLLSSASVSADDPVFGPIHRELRSGAAEWAVLRPSYFMQNFSETAHAYTIRESNRIFTAAGSGKVGFVDAEDIAAVAAEALTRPEPFNDELVITGPEALSYGEAAERIGELTGLPVQHIAITEDELRQNLIAVGLPREYAAFLAGLDTRIRVEGSEDRVTDTVRRVTGREPRSLKDHMLANPASLRLEPEPARDQAGRAKL